METDRLRAWKAKGKGRLRNAGGNKEKKSRVEKGEKQHVEEKSKRTWHV